MNNCPDFIIIGAMKCGTSTLHEQLALQPSIFMSTLKEPNFFSDDQEYYRGIEWYLAHFQQARANELCGESSTHYTKLPTYPHTVERICQHLSGVKFIYIIRHPIDRLVSHYIHEWTQKVISVEINQAVNQHRELIDYSCYSMQLKPYFETFGQQSVLPVFFERLLTHKQEELERICRFIGYKGQPIWNRELDAQNVSNERMRKSWWRDFLVEVPGLREIRRTFIPKSWRNSIRRLWMIKKKPELELKQIEYLQEVFDRDLSILSSWLGTSLCCENFKAKTQSQSLDWLER
ncbi:MAG: sulfotransferase [Cyanobacteria bacterium]|jgi:hypothetical protein|nr:sulfotransferase [Cyanobacteria bacterium GSL.Bin1]